MNKSMEKLAILSLSLLLVSTYSVSAALPAMLDFFDGHSRTEVEQLISVTSFAIMIMVILNTRLSGILSERRSITIGILLMVAGGSAPMFLQQYGILLAARILLGVGIGLINTYAITMINERYDGQERAVLLGFRGSAEVLGNAVLTLLAGRLLVYGWTRAFAVYLAGLPVLLLYLLFVPERDRAAGKRRKGMEAAAGRSTAGTAEEKKGKSAAGKSCAAEKEASRENRYACRAFLAGCGLMGSLMICMNSCCTMRIPSLVLERGFGTESDASLVLSAMLAAGMAAGICFGMLTAHLERWMMPVLLLIYAAGMAVMAFSGHMLVLAAGAMLAGMANSLLVTVQFHRVATGLPSGLMSLGTTCVLVGCNLGAFVSPAVLRVIDSFDGSMGASFTFFAVLLLVLGTAMTVLTAAGGSEGGRAGSRAQNF